MEFNYNFYVNKYCDLAHLNRNDAYLHWINYGIKEGRMGNTNPINIETNITIMIHLFHENLFTEFLSYIDNVKQIFKFVNIIFTINIHSNFEDNIKKANDSFIVIKVENKGVDIYPFIECIKYIRKNKIKTDFILKLHTKISTNISEDLINWRIDLIDPIVRVDNLFIIQHYFKNISNIGYVGSQKCVVPKNYDLDFPQNLKGLNDLCKQFINLEKEWTDFNAGNIFWINNTVLTEYLTTELIDYLTDKFIYGKPPCNLTNNGIYVEYLCERLFTGIFCYNKTNILVNDYKGTNRGIGKNMETIDNSYFYQPKIFSLYSPKNIITK